MLKKLIWSFSFLLMLMVAMSLGVALRDLGVPLLVRLVLCFVIGWFWPRPGRHQTGATR